MKKLINLLYDEKFTSVLLLNNINDVMIRYTYDRDTKKIFIKRMTAKKISDTKETEIMFPSFSDFLQALIIKMGERVNDLTIEREF